MPYGKPLARTREYIEIVRKVFAREAPLTHKGEHYQIPYGGPDATGLGKPLKSTMHPDPSLKIYTAAFSPAGLRTAGELADGVQPIYMSPERTGLITEPVLEGMAVAGKGKTLAEFDIAPFVRVAMGKDLQACRNALKPEMALYIGGMGARTKNFYNDYVKRLGRRRARRARRRDGAGRSPGAHQGPAAGLEGGCQGQQDRHHAGGRRQRRGLARHRRSGALTPDVGFAAGGGIGASNQKAPSALVRRAPHHHVRGEACAAGARSIRPAIGVGMRLAARRMEPRWLARRQVVLPPSPARNATPAPTRCA
jgi:hypothetical protein